jgi:hypothetical protein
MGLHKSNKNIDRNPDPEIVGQILEFERLSPASTKQRLHRYILRNYTPEGRRIVYRRSKSRSAEPVDRRRKLTPKQVLEVRADYATGKMRMRQLARRCGVSVSTISNAIHGGDGKIARPSWKHLP